MPTSRIYKTDFHHANRRPHSYLSILSIILIFTSFAVVSSGLHDAKLVYVRSSLPTIETRQEQNEIPLMVTNNCADDIYPGITTQSGTGPSQTGFQLSSGSTNNLTVSPDWQGRIWGRTNCSFNSDGTGPSNNSPGKACGTGDCNGILNCQVTGDTPVTLAEIALNGGDGKTYYDISLVDGYNVPMAIVLNSLGNENLASISPNLTNPSCVATAGLLAPMDFNPYSNGQMFLGTSSWDPLPFDTSTSDSDVANWCPWDLQVNQPTGPSDGVYQYPDTNVQRPQFDPCYSACAKYNDDADCCTGQYGTPQTCMPSQYSQAAKKVCPDAYSYAFDDQTSTFIVPTGAGFQIIFCPGGRSTNILSAESSELSQLTNTVSMAIRDSGEMISSSTVTSIDAYDSTTLSVIDISIDVVLSSTSTAIAQDGTCTCATRSTNSENIGTPSCNGGNSDRIGENNNLGSDGGSTSVKGSNPANLSGTEVSDLNGTPKGEPHSMETQKSDGIIDLRTILGITPTSSGIHSSSTDRSAQLPSSGADSAARMRTMVATISMVQGSISGLGALFCGLTIIAELFTLL